MRNGTTLRGDYLQIGPAISSGMIRPSVHSTATSHRLCGHISAGWHIEKIFNMQKRRTAALLGGSTDWRLTIKYRRREMMRVAMGLTKYTMSLRREPTMSVVDVSELYPIT